jgi:hypothetical protein
MDNRTGFMWTMGQSGNMETSTVTTNVRNGYITLLIFYLFDICGHLDIDQCGPKVNSGSGVKPKAAEEGGSDECQRVINLKLRASQRVNCTKQRKTKLVRAISHDKKFKCRQEMLPANNVPGHNNLHMYQL